MRVAMVCLLPLLLFGSVFKAGDRIEPKRCIDQYGKQHLLGAQRSWVVAWDRGTTGTANRYFEQHPGLLGNEKVALIVDVSQTPAGIMSLFVMPRMRSYAHPVLLSYDETFNRKLPYREGMLTVLHWHKGRISSVEFAEDEAALAAMLREKQAIESK